MDEPQTNPRLPWAKPFLIALMALGCAVFFLRGPYRALTGSSGDFAMIYGSARAWLVGVNPYSAQDVGRAFAAAGGDTARNPEQFGAQILLYPPPTFPILAPIAALPWPVAVAVWAVLSTILWIVTVLAAARVAGFQRGSTAWWALFAGGAWLAPAVTNLAVGQVAVAAGALVALAQARRIREDNRRGLISGALLGLGMALKPQVAGLFTIYEAGRLRWRRAAASFAVAAIVAAIGIARMEAAGIPWRSAWTQNLADFTTRSNGDPTRANAIRYQILSLHYPLHTLLDNRDAVKALVYAIVGGLCLVYLAVDLRRGRQRGEGRSELVSLSMTAVVSLMVVYHRFYDAVLLIWPLTLAIDGLARRRPRPGLYLAILALTALFAAPGAVILAELAQRHSIPSPITGTPVWDTLILPHEAWALVAMAGLLIWVRATSRPAHSAPGGRASPPGSP